MIKFVEQGKEGKGDFQHINIILLCKSSLKNKCINQWLKKMLKIIHFIKKAFFHYYFLYLLTFHFNPVVLKMYLMISSTLLMCIDWAIGLISRVFTNSQRDRGPIPGRVIPKTQKMVLDTTLLNTQHYKIRIKGKVKQPRERSSTLPYTSVL